MHISLYEDHGGGFLSFANRDICLSFNGGSKAFSGEMEIHIFDHFWQFILDASKAIKSSLFKFGTSLTKKLDKIVFSVMR